MLSDAAHSVHTNVSSNIGDLLGLSDEKEPHATSAQPPCCATSQLGNKNPARHAQPPWPCSDVCKMVGPAGKLLSTQCRAPVMGGVRGSLFALQALRTLPQETDAIGEYLAALSLAASNSSADAPALVKRLNSSVLDPTLSAGACAAHCQLILTVTADVVARGCLTPVSPTLLSVM